MIMDDEDEIFYTSMYGPEELTKDPAKTYQIMAGLKLSGAHIQTLNFNGQEVKVPGVRYMQLLDEQLRDSKKRIKVLENMVGRMERRISKLELENLNNKIAKSEKSYE